MMATIFNSSILNSAILDTAILHKTLTQTSSILLKLIHSDSTWWWQPTRILPSCIQPFAQKKLHSCILTQIDDCSHLEFCYLGFRHFAQKKNFTCSFWLNLMIAAILKSAILDSAILYKKNFLDSFWLNLMMAAILNFAIMNSAICTKRTSLIHSESTWWWQPFWTLSSWIQTLPSWIQTPSYLLSDSLKNTLPPLLLWLKLIQSD